MSSGKKVYTSESVQKANRKFMLKRHNKAEPKDLSGAIRSLQKDHHELTSTQPPKNPDQTKIGDE